jgi:lipoprotein signal peptidase
VGLGLVIGGAVGNLIDRAVRPAGVLDFVDLGWWPQFNAADAAVVCGAILIAWCVFRAGLVEHAFLRKHLLIETAEIADDPERGEA